MRILRISPTASRSSRRESWRKRIFEQRIAERTGELLAANRALENEVAARRKGEAALRESDERRRLLAIQLIDAQELERKTIAHDLHDVMGHSLTSIKLCLENTIEKNASASKDLKLREVVDQVRTAIRQVHEISVNLRPPILDDLGVVATLSWFCRNFEAMCPWIFINQQIHVNESQIPDHLKIPIFRITQEALNNAAKHSQCKQVTCRLLSMAGKIELEIIDDGVGFDMQRRCLPNESTKITFGLSTMKDRAELSGGTFNVLSAGGAGTTVHAEWTCR